MKQQITRTKQIGSMKTKWNRLSFVFVSTFMATRKQLLSWGLGVPALNRVGEAWVNHRSLRCRYVSMADLMSCKMSDILRLRLLIGQNSSVWYYSVLDGSTEYLSWYEPCSEWELHTQYNTIRSSKELHVLICLCRLKWMLQKLSY